MMRRLDASLLIAALDKPNKQLSYCVVLSDLSLFEHLMRRRVRVSCAFAGKNSLADYVNYVATCGLFEPPQISFIHLGDLTTAKSWREMQVFLARLPITPEAPAYFLASTAQRHIIKETDFPKGTDFILCYEPTDVDRAACVQALMARYPHCAQQPPAQKQAWVQQALEAYGNDLLSCDLHFQRMEKGGLAFAEALVGSSEITGFHVVDAFAKRDAALVALRLAQCADCGQEAGAIFAILVAFLKQAAAVLACLQETRDIKKAFAQAQTPYPAQARLQRCLSFLTPAALHSFFVTAARIEWEIRQQKSPHQYLSVELVGWLSQIPARN